MIPPKLASRTVSPPLSRRRGFSLVEALASTVLLGVGIAASMSALGALTREEARAERLDRYTVLARSKWDELSVDTVNAASGDFSDQNAPDVAWTLTTNPSGIENLNTVLLVVRAAKASSSSPQVTLSGLRFTPPTTTAAAGAGN